jgi:hypothetical protein
MPRLSEFTASMTTSTRCGACGRAGALRRGRCEVCYEHWLSSRPVGIGAVCASCGDRRIVHLRYFELHRMWVVLCHNCTARAQRLSPMPRSTDALLVALGRDRRQADRRTRSPREVGWYEAVERRRQDRRRTDREAVVDVTDLAEVIIELEAEFGSLADGRYDGPITEVHARLDPSEL